MSTENQGAADSVHADYEKQLQALLSENTFLLAACKAKDEALAKIRDEINGEQFPSGRELVRICESAIALQPDSSVKPAQETFRRSEAGNQ